MADQQTLEALDALESLVLTYKSVMEDGKVGVFDIPKFIPLFLKFKKGAEGAGEIPGELSHLSDEETQALLKRLGDIVVEVVEIIGAQLPAVA